MNTILNISSNTKFRFWWQCADSIGEYSPLSNCLMRMKNDGLCCPVVYQSTILNTCCNNSRTIWSADKLTEYRLITIVQRFILEQHYIVGLYITVVSNTSLYSRFVRVYYRSETLTLNRTWKLEFVQITYISSEIAFFGYDAASESGLCFCDGSQYCLSYLQQLHQGARLDYLRVDLDLSQKKRLLC